MDFIATLNLEDSGRGIRRIQIQGVPSLRSAKVQATRTFEINTGKWYDWETNNGLIESRKEFFGGFIHISEKDPLWDIDPDGEGFPVPDSII